MSIVPVIDFSDFAARSAAIAEEVGRACRSVGFFYVSGHDVPQALIDDLFRLSKAFFELPTEEKMDISMQKGGRAWRGYFPLGDELTSGKPDLKEGLYLGSELPDDHPAVLSKKPIHGSNLWPKRIPDLRNTVLQYMASVTALGHQVMESISLSLGLPTTYFNDLYTKDPTILFRAFNYPVVSKEQEGGFGVGAHTDYGLLTLLLQDDSGGLEVHVDGQWVEAPPIAGTFVINIGDMLERMTKGLYRSTLHRVRNKATHDRLSFPLFFDPNFDSVPALIDCLAVAEATVAAATNAAGRWDKESVLGEWQGTYGDYLLKKVGRVFPQLMQAVL